MVRSAIDPHPGGSRSKASGASSRGRSSVAEMALDASVERGTFTLGVVAAAPKYAPIAARGGALETLLETAVDP